MPSCEMLMKAALLLLLLYPAAQFLWLGCHVVVVFSTCGLQTEHVYRSQVHHVACVVAVTDQLCVVVVSCTTGSMVGQLLVRLGCWV